MASSTFPAKYRGKCDACGEWFLEGTEITRLPGGGYVEVDCNSEGPSVARVNNEVCGRCFQAKSLTGACDCE